jgi:hypothetical protein
MGLPPRGRNRWGSPKRGNETRSGLADGSAPIVNSWLSLVGSLAGIVAARGMCVRRDSGRERSRQLETCDTTGRRALPMSSPLFEVSPGGPQSSQIPLRLCLDPPYWVRTMEFVIGRSAFADAADACQTYWVSAYTLCSPRTPRPFLLLSILSKSDFLFPFGPIFSERDCPFLLGPSSLGSPASTEPKLVPVTSGALPWLMLTVISILLVVPAGPAWLVAADTGSNVSVGNADVVGLRTDGVPFIRAWQSSLISPF